MQLLALLLIVAGEGLMIYAEELGAKLYALPSATFVHEFGYSFGFAALGAVCLVAGYMLGLRYFHNIWIVTVISFASILLMEPLFNFFYIGQTPTLGALIGFVLAVLGIIAATFL